MRMRKRIEDMLDSKIVREASERDINSQYPCRTSITKVPWNLRFEA